MSDDQNTTTDENTLNPADNNPPQVPTAEVPFVMKDLPINVRDILHTAYLQYSLSVNVGRAIPDVRDGLKPVNRRILYSMWKQNMTKSSSFTKSARVVGDVLAKYHPHGDSSVYDAMVRMAQDFNMRSPLIDGQGNFGSVDGDPAAAYRYTEARMERVSEELLADLDKNTVDMVPTFDEKEVEPTVLPAKFPHLLVNGTTGIGVGMATNIPTHNLGEIIDATIMIMDNPEVSTSELMTVIPGPDFPTGGIICGRNESYRFFEHGRGVITMRARAHIVEDEKNGREQIIVTEIPYTVNKEMMVAKIADLVRDKRITGITGLRDESSARTGMRVVIDIKKGQMASIVLNQLYTHTAMQTTFAACMLVVNHNKPMVMNLRGVLIAWLDHRIEVVMRRAKFELDRKLERAHIVEGLLTAVRNIDDVIHIIRDSQNRDEARDRLIARFEFSRRQAGAILDMRLHQLTGLAIGDLEKEFADLLARIDELRAILASRARVLEIIKTELLEVKNKYADPRRSEIIAAADDLSIADLITPHSCILTVSKAGYVKRQPADTFKTQNRGGKGILGMNTKDEDHVEHLFNANSHDLIFFITQKGVMHWRHVYDIPEGSRVSKGQAIINLIKIDPGEQIQALFTAKQDDMQSQDKYLFMATRNGTVKKTPLYQFRHLRKAGIRALALDEGDEIIGAAVTDGNSHIVLSTAKGLANHFIETGVRPMGRNARGVRGIRFRRDGDYVVSMQVFTMPEDLTENGPEILVITSGGMGKRSFVKDYRLTRRGSGGVTSIRFKNEMESVVSTLEVENGDEIMITTKDGIIVRLNCDSLRTLGRASMGVRLMKFKNEKDFITSVAKVASLDGEKIDDETIEKAELPEQDPEDLADDNAPIDDDFDENEEIPEDDQAQEIVPDEENNDDDR